MASEAGVSVQRAEMVESIRRNAGLSLDQVKALEAEGIDLRAVGLAAFDAVITEESTDRAIALLLARVKLPVYLRWVPLGRVLDAVLPEKLRQVFKAILYAGDR